MYPEIKQIMGVIPTEQAQRFTYCLLDDTRETQIGTAVAIKLGKRFFLATARHLIKNACGVKALVRDQVAHYFTKFIARHYDDHFDVGLLEISSSDSHCFEFLPQNRICEIIEDEQILPVKVVGFPGQFCKSGKNINLRAETLFQVVQYTAITCHTFVLPRSEWPSDGLPDEHSMYKKLVDGRDMLINYNYSPECFSLDPRGMSGGGIWLAQRAESEEELNYSDTRLVGLQLSWYETRNWLRGIRVGAWLDLVRDRYSDLREVTLLSKI